tara:strand:- start:851 stop:1117 length:267 start_codon:yes stop_codon:yes gene_type:complete
MYAVVMSDWNYTKCTKPFSSIEEAEAFMIKKDFAGHILKRNNGYSAVCPAYPDGYYSDAVLVLSRDNEKRELSSTAKQLPISSASDCC